MCLEGVSRWKSKMIESLDLFMGVVDVGNNSRA
jgi:hypothetical protein